jgi:predicted ATP-grasp superfamily ATP-dependent carboligase
MRLKMSQDQNPLKAQPGWPAAVVLGAYYTGVNLVRYLVRRGLTAYCIDNDRKRQGFRSVYGKTFECPDPDRKPAEWLGFMLELARKVGGKPVLIPSADAFVSAMAKHADELEKAYLFCHDTVALQGLLATKQRQYDLAVEHGMPVPRTKFAQSPEEVAEFGSRAEFPCVIKPVRSYDWAKVPRGHPLAGCKVAFAKSINELEEKYRIVAVVNPEVVVQEVIEGPDTAKLVYLSCYATDRRRIARCLLRELRTAPIYNGNASVVEPVEDAETDSLCDGFLKSIGYAGLCEIELKRDSRDGRVKMIEANPRYTGTSDAAPYAGVDLGWLHYLDLIGQRVEMVSQDGRNFRHIVLTWDIKTIGNYRRAGLLTWRDLIRSYRPPVAFFDFDLRNWRVAAGTLFTLAYWIIGRPVRRLFSKRRSF